MARSGCQHSSCPVQTCSGLYHLSWRGIEIPLTKRLRTVVSPFWKHGPGPCISQTQESGKRLRKSVSNVASSVTGLPIEFGEEKVGRLQQDELIDSEILRASPRFLRFVWKVQEGHVWHHRWRCWSSEKVFTKWGGGCRLRRWQAGCGSETQGLTLCSDAQVVEQNVPTCNIYPVGLPPVMYETSSSSSSSSSSSWWSTSSSRHRHRHHDHDHHH